MIRLSVLSAAMMLAAPALAAAPSVDPVAAPAGSAAAPALLPSAASTPAPTVVASNTVLKKQKVHCRIDYEIGSLVKRTRRCGDTGTWAKSDQAARDQVRQMQDDLKGRFTGN